MRLFGNTGHCAACSKVIPAFEMVMRARSNVYHLECFACQQCNHRFCVGDRFYLCDNKILCEYDYEERLVFAHLAVSPSGLALAKRQAQAAPGNTQSPGGRGPPPGATLLPPLPPPLCGDRGGGPAPPGGGPSDHGASVYPSATDLAFDSK